MPFIPDKNTFRLLRIPFSIYLMPVFLLALSQAKSPDWLTTTAGFLIIHLLVYPASNGYNSYVDRDETAIGGLEHPPLPTTSLYYLTLAMDALAILLSLFLVGSLFSACIALYILASRAYSSPTIRLKKYPIAGFLVVVFFQGGFTFLMSLQAIEPNSTFFQTPENGWILAATSLQIGGAYPLTQIYQHEADLKDGVRTISWKLGYRGTFLFTCLMFGLANLSYFQYFINSGQMSGFIQLQVFFIPVLVFFGWWMRKVWADPAFANFNFTMKMNKVAALSMNACFLLFILQNHFK